MSQFHAESYFRFVAILYSYLSFCFCFRACSLLRAVFDGHEDKFRASAGAIAVRTGVATKTATGQIKRPASESDSSASSNASASASPTGSGAGAGAAGALGSNLKVGPRPSHRRIARTRVYSASAGFSEGDAVLLADAAKLVLARIAAAKSDSADAKATARAESAAAARAARAQAAVGVEADAVEAGPQTQYSDDGYNNNVSNAAPYSHGHACQQQQQQQQQQFGQAGGSHNKNNNNVAAPNASAADSAAAAAPAKKPAPAKYNKEDAKRQALLKMRAMTQW